MLRKRQVVIDRVWQKPFYDFNVCTDKKRVEKLRYLHRNPVKRGLVRSPEEWDWSSFRTYLNGEQGIVEVIPCPWRFQHLNPTQSKRWIDWGTRLVLGIQAAASRRAPPPYFDSLPDTAQ